MEEKRGRCRRREKQPLGLRTLLRREGRRWCAAALCVSMIAGNTLSLAMAAEKSTGSFLFRLDRAALYGALQEAILEDELVDRDFAFEGEMAEEYTLLLNGSGEEEGSLYELNPVIANNDDRLNLRIFARLDGEIPLQAEDGEEQEEYEITGNEKFIFLLTNRSGREQSAVIQVDEKKTGIVIIPPGSEVSTLAEPDGKEPGEETKGEKETDQEKELEAKPSAGGGGGGSGSAGGGGSAGSGGSAGGSGSVEGGGNASWDNGQQGDSDSAGADLTEGEEKPGQNGDSDREDLPSTEVGTGDTKPDGGTAPEESGNVTSDNKSDNDSSNDDSGGNSTVSGGSQESGSSDTGNTDSGSDQGSGDSGNGNDGGGDTGSSTDSGDTGSSSAGGGDGGSSSADSGSTGSGDSGSSSADSGSTGSGDIGSASSGDSSDSLVSISCHKAGLVASSLSKEAASPSDAEEKEEASPSDAVKEENLSDGNEAKEEASPSDAEEETLEGQWYEAVYLRESGVVAFVTTAMDLGLDEEDFREASSADALPARMYTAEKTVGRVTVEVIAEEGVIPEEAELQVTELTKDGNAEEADKYAKAEQALEEAGTEYTGMMAVDISFWLDGEEIEPDGPVQVSMRVDSEQLPKEADLESLEIHHLVGTDEIEAVEIVADSGDKAEGFIEVNEAEALAAEFEVESFSTFTITWGVANPNKGQYGDIQVNINATCYEIIDGTTKRLEEEDKSIEIPYYKGEGEEATIDLFQESRIAQTGWYRLVKITTNVRGEEKEFTKLGILPAWAPLREGNEESGYHVEYQAQSVGVTCYNGSMIYQLDPIQRFIIDLNSGREITYKENEQEKTAWTYMKPDNMPKDNMITLDVSLVYERDNRQVRIVNNIKNDGCLKAELSSTLLEGQREGGSYKWFKSSDGIKWVFVEEGNISEGGKSVNVARDNGGQHHYKVEAYDKNKTLIGEDTFFVEYYNYLKNGTFSQGPAVASSGEKYNNYHQFPEGTENLIWKTTEPSKSIELVKKENWNHNLNQGDTELPDGDSQCAELNSRGEGALYQDVLTVPETKLHWRLYHRARGPQGGEKGLTDTMFLVIMPTSLAEEYNNDHSGLKSAIREYLEQGDGKEYSDDNGIYIQKITSSNYAWYEYRGTYMTGNRDNSYLTRFFFVAGDEVSSHDIREGNLLDDVWFDTELPPPKPDTGRLSVRKIVSGLPENEAKLYEIGLTITNNKTKENTNLRLSNFSNEEGDDSKGYSDEDYLDLTPGEYTIKEIAPTKENYDLKYAVREVEKNGDVAFTNSFQIKVTLAKNSTTEVEFKNEYIPKTQAKKLIVTKKVEGNLGDKDKSFTFEYKIVDNQDQELPNYDSIKVDGIEVPGDKKFQLKHGESKNIEGIPSGYKVIIKEIDADGYEVSAKATGENNKELSLSPLSENNAIVKGAYELTMTEETEVIFTNKRSVSTPTGIHGNRLPNLLLLAMAALGMAGMAATGTTAKVHKKEEE